MARQGPPGRVPYDTAAAGSHTCRRDSAALGRADIAKRGPRMPMSVRLRSGSHRLSRRGGHGVILAFAMAAGAAVLAIMLALVLRWRALVPPDPAAKPVASGDPPAFDRLFVTIAALDDALGPAERIRTIYPRYFDFGRFAGPDGLLVIRFREGTPYQAEDLFYDPAAPDRPS